VDPSSGVHTISCTGSGPFNFGAITLGGGVTATFAAGSYQFAGGSCNGSTNVSIATPAPA
jgi:hypothetical protein